VDDLEIEASDLWKFGTGVLVVFLFMMIALTLIVSIFKGSFIHAAVVTYAGYDPTAYESMRIGKEKGLAIFGFNFILGSVTIIASLVLIELPTYLSGGDLYVIVPFTIIFVIFDIVLSCAMIAGNPAIITEEISALEAFKRSGKLCQKSVCAIFSSCLSFGILEILLSLALQYIGHEIHAIEYYAVFAIFRAIIFVMMLSLGSILTVVLYMTCRIKMENCTKQKLVEDLKLDTMPEQYVEMTDQNKVATAHNKQSKINDYFSPSTVTATKLPPNTEIV